MTLSNCSPTAAPLSILTPLLWAMEQCKDDGLVKSIGVSNFNLQQLELILNKADLKYKPVCNQLSDELKKAPTISNAANLEILDQTIRDKVKEATKTGLDIGYRHVDSAFFYLTEESIGRAFREKFSDGDIKREDVFHTTKLWGTFHQPHLVRPALERSLASLQLDYVDLFIIHFPISLQPGDDLLPVDENGVSLLDDVDLRQTWEAMEQCKDDGLVKSIGVSNFNRQQLELILNKADLKYKPVCNQVECHPYLTQEPMLEFCKANNIVLTAYGVLGSPTGVNWVDANCPALLQDPVLTLIGQKYNKSPAQVSIRYLIQRGCVPIVKSFNPDRMRQNLQVFDFHLNPKDMDAIAKLNRNMRYWKFTMWASHPNYHFNRD